LNNTIITGRSNSLLILCPILEMGSGKWEMRSEKWEMGSGKWEVGSGK